MDDEAIKAALDEVGAGFLMDPDDSHGQPNALRHLAEAAGDAARAEILDAMDHDMPLDCAVQLASLWSAGKLIGGDAHAVSIALLRELQRLRSSAANHIPSV